LLLRIRDPANDQAWAEFLAIYQPLVYRLARRKGLQDADAQDLTQDVFAAVASAVDRWTPDPQRGRFRAWLFRIARNLTINFLARQRRMPQGSGDTRVHELLEEHPSDDAEDAILFEDEYRRQGFRWAVEQVRDEFQERTWNAFWWTSVEGRTIPEVAQALRLTPGAVYVARSRVMARLRQKVEMLGQDERAGADSARVDIY
jgi:RNA polymerase sigma-70 factor (ECF subfamily)